MKRFVSFITRLTKKILFVFILVSILSTCKVTLPVAKEGKTKKKLVVYFKRGSFMDRI